MSINSLAVYTGPFFRNRVLRNVVLWSLLFLITHTINVENSEDNHFAFLRSSWYWFFVVGGYVLQMVLIYTNNLVLIPRFLEARRHTAYRIWLLLLAVGISLGHVACQEIAAAHIGINDIVRVGLARGLLGVPSTGGPVLDYLIVNVSWIFLFRMAWYMNNYAHQQQIAAEARRRQSEAELAFLHSQLTPHFLFNTLNNIYALTLRESSAGPEAMLKLSAILRSLLYEGGTALVSFEREAGVIRAYTDLELLRLKDVSRFNFQIHADQDYNLPPLLWLPVLENIFKHGTRTISDHLFVDFSFVIKESVLTIRGRNYCKEQPLQKAGGEGIGLMNLQKRLAILYPGKYTFHAAYADQAFNTEITVKLP